MVVDFVDGITITIMVRLIDCISLSLSLSEYPT